ncbi:MAG: Gfo/Idh/MocA family oxidoreductase [Aureliella sp.]
MRVGFIGVGGRGGSNLQAIASDPGVTVAALCDVNAKSLEVADRRFPGAKKFRDFRQLYSTCDDLDAVVVSTTEHTHAFATMPALRRGWHVYCEKPLTHNIGEARAITEAAAQANVATQMGTQIHAGANYHRVVQLIQSGVIGPVREAHVWVGRAWGRQSAQEAAANKDRVTARERPAEAMTPPVHLDWDLWIGPAPYRPFHSVYLPGPNWYRWWDFGNGTMSDLGSHWIDLPFWALQLDAPKSVVARGPEPHAEIAPASMSAHYQYAARGESPACSVHWYQGSEKPQKWIDKEIPQWKSGCLFVGDDGMLLSDYGKFQLLPKEKFAAVKLPDPPMDIPSSHHADWLTACREGTPTGSPFSYAGPLTEANHLGNVAFRSGGEIVWDAARATVTNKPAAMKFVSRTPRDGWSL